MKIAEKSVCITCGKEIDLPDMKRCGECIHKTMAGQTVSVDIEIFENHYGQDACFHMEIVEYLDSVVVILEAEDEDIDDSVYEVEAFKLSKVAEGELESLICKSFIGREPTLNHIIPLLPDGMIHIGEEK